MEFIMATSKLNLCSCLAVIFALVLFAGAGAQACGPIIPAVKPEIVRLNSAKATVIPSDTMSPSSMEYCSDSSAVRGEFLADTVAVNDALNNRFEKPVMIFVFDRGKALSHGCELHPETIFGVLINSVSATAGKTTVQFGHPNLSGVGRMTLGAFHSIELRGCIAVPLQGESTEPDAKADSKKDD